MEASKGKRIIIEGPDGAGKSTLSARIKSIYPGLDIVHMKGRDSMDYDFLKQTLKKTDIIWDRHFPSENIYSYFYKKPFRITTGQTKELVNYCKENDIVILVCAPDVYHVMEDEDEDIKQRHNKLVDGYTKFCADNGIIPIDNHTITNDELKRIIETQAWHI